MLPNLCARDLADILGGELMLASLPPLGGPLEPVVRVVSDPAMIRPGDVFWSIDSGVPADWIFASQALGVIAERPVEPWAGRFTICIDDPCVALSRAAEWVIAHQPATRILVVEDEPQTSLLIHQLLSTRLLGSVTEGLHWPLDLLGDALTSDFIVVAINEAFLEINALAPQSHLCSSDILVISSLANRECHTRERIHSMISAEIDQLQARNCLIVSGDDSLPTSPKDFAGRVFVCGEQSHCSVQANAVVRNSSELRFDFAGQAIEYRGSGSLIDVLTAFAAARALNWTDAEILGACQELFGKCVSQ